MFLKSLKALFLSGFKASGKVEENIFSVCKNIKIVCKNIQSVCKNISGVCKSVFIDK